MRRDMDLIRELMLKLEEVKLPYRGRKVIDPGGSDVAVPPHTFDEVGYHLDLIDQAGFLQDAGSRAARGVMFAGISPAGHDFLEAVREPKVWTETKSRAEKVGGWTVGILTDLAKGYIKAKAMEHGFPLGG